MAVCGNLGDKSIFLKDEFENKIVLAESASMEGLVLSVPNM